jgi:hypothetical protein
MIRVFAIIALVHLYRGWRLLPDRPFGAPGVVATMLLLVLTALVMSLGQFARRSRRSPSADQLTGVGFVAMG